MLKTLIGKRVTTFDGHSGIVIKHFKPTGRDITVHIKQDDGRIWYCPENYIIDVKEKIRYEKNNNKFIDNNSNYINRLVIKRCGNTKC